MPTFAKKVIITFADADSYYHGDNTAIDPEIKQFMQPRIDSGLTDGVPVKDPATLTLTRVWLDQASAEEYVAFATNNGTTYSVSMTSQIVDNT